MFLENEEIDSLAATCKAMKEKMDTEAIWHVRYNNNMEDGFHDGPTKLHTADSWKNYVFWQRSDIAYSDNSLFGQQARGSKVFGSIPGSGSTELDLGMK